MVKNLNAPEIELVNYAKKPFTFTTAKSVGTGNIIDINGTPSMICDNNLATSYGITFTGGAGNTSANGSMTIDLGKTILFSTINSIFGFYSNSKYACNASLSWSADGTNFNTISSLGIENNSNPSTQTESKTTQVLNLRYLRISAGFVAIVNANIQGYIQELQIISTL